MSIFVIRTSLSAALLGLCAAATSYAGPDRCEQSSHIPWVTLEQRDADGGLLPAYRDTMRRPLEYFGISIWSGPEEGGGYLGALADPATVEAGATNVFVQSEVVETQADYREMAELGVGFLPFTHTLFSPVDDERGFYTYEKVKRIIGFLEKEGVAATAYFGLANHPGFPIFTLAYAKQDPARYQVDAAGRTIHRVVQRGTVLNPALSWEHPDLAAGAIKSAAHHAEDWKGFSNVPFWCLMGENLFGDKTGDYCEAHRLHFAAWLKHRYRTAEAWAKAWGPDTPTRFADAPTPTVSSPETLTPAELDKARFRRESLAELYRAVRVAVRAADPERPAFGLFHGSTDRPKQLVEMGVHPDRIAAATDGIASSHILWPNTEDPRNLLNLAVFRSFGRPVVVPIFGLEQDRVINDFTSANYKVDRIARRVYEHMGLGVWGLAVGYWKVWGWTLAHHEEGKREIARLCAELKGLETDSELMQPVSFPVGFVIAADDAAVGGMPEVYKTLYAGALSRGLPVEFVYEERLLSGRPAVPSVLVVAGACGLSEAGLATLRAHVESGGSALLWPQGNADWCPKDLPKHERVRLHADRARPAPGDVVDWLAARAGPDAVPVRYGDGSAPLESFALTDGVNALVIAVNTADQPIDAASFELGEHLVAGKPRWHVRVGAGATVAGRRVELSLRPHGVAVLYGETRVPKSWDLAGERARLETALGAAEAQGFHVDHARRNLDSAAAHLKAGRPAKALACLLHVRRTLLVRIQSPAKGETLAARVRVVSLGAPLPTYTEVQLRFPDHGNVRVDLEKRGRGEWTGKVARDGRLAVYDYDLSEYRPEPGPVAVEAEARAGARAGASPILMWMP